MGFTGFDAHELETFTLFHIESSWVQSLQSAGVTGMGSDKILALRIFMVDAAYVRDLTSPGYSPLSADTLVAFKSPGGLLALPRAEQRSRPPPALLLARR